MSFHTGTSTGDLDYAWRPSSHPHDLDITRPLEMYLALYQHSCSRRALGASRVLGFQWVSTSWWSGTCDWGAQEHLQEEDVGVLEQWTMLLSDRHEPMIQVDDDLGNRRLLLVYEGVGLLKALLRRVMDQNDKNNILLSKKTTRDAPVSSLIIASLSG